MLLDGEGVYYNAGKQNKIVRKVANVMAES